MSGRELNTFIKMNSEDLSVIETMTRYGGSFAKALAEAARRADDDNLGRIKAAWPEYWQKYLELSSLDVVVKQEPEDHDEDDSEAYRLVAVIYGTDHGLVSLSPPPGRLLMSTWDTSNVSWPWGTPRVVVSDHAMTQLYGEEHDWNDVRDLLSKYYDWHAKTLNLPNEPEV
jgi:hypothetical protein